MLYAEFEKAALVTQLSRQFFAAQQENYWVGRALYIEASYLRRQSKFSEAGDILDEAIRVFRSEGASVYVAIAQKTDALLTFLQYGDADRAARVYQEAIAVFEEADMPLWSAQCYNSLADVENFRGNLTRAGECLRTARQVYARYQILGFRGDNLLDSGIWEMYRGNFRQSLLFVNAAEDFHHQIGNQWAAFVAGVVRGELYLKIGRYQHALFELETVYQKYKELEVPQRASEAGQFWQKALQSASGLQPEMAWQAFTGLGDLAAQTGDSLTALAHYRQALKALFQLRQEQWQAPLIGTYMARPADFLRRAMVPAQSNGITADLLTFLKASKAN